MAVDLAVAGLKLAYSLGKAGFTFVSQDQVNCGNCGLELNGFEAMAAIAKKETRETLSPDRMKRMLAWVMNKRRVKCNGRPGKPCGAVGEWQAIQEKSEEKHGDAAQKVVSKASLKNSDSEQFLTLDLELDEVGWTEFVGSHEKFTMKMFDDHVKILAKHDGRTYYVGADGKQLAVNDEFDPATKLIIHSNGDGSFRLRNAHGKFIKEVGDRKDIESFQLLVPL